MNDPASEPALDALTIWAEVETDRQNRMITAVIGALLIRLGETRVEISMGDVEAAFARPMTITYEPGGDVITYRLAPEEDPAQNTLPLEATSGAESS